MGKPHKHAEVIKAWADDPEQGVQFFDHIHEKWLDVETISWVPTLQYRIKPKTININGYEVPEPVRVALNKGDTYYMVSPYGAGLMEWHGNAFDFELLKNGAIHLTRDAAMKHHEAIFSFTRKP